MNLSVPTPTLTAALLLGAALALHGTPCLAGPGPMQVEEPEMQSSRPPIQPEKDGEGWKSRKQAGLTASQQAALAARQKTMKDMMALIQRKRLAIREARPEDRKELALELQSLILEQAQGADRIRSQAPDRKEGPPAGEADLGAQARTRDEALDQRERGLEQKLRQQEAHRQLIEEKLKQLEDKAASGGKKAEED